MSAGTVLTRREVEASVQALRPLPQAVSRLVELMEHETATLAEAETLLQSEPVLCGMVLRVANSAYYGLPRGVSSIRQALILLGAHTVKGIALSVAAVGSVRDARAPTPQERALWRHAITVAGYAQRIARACRLGTQAVEDTYIAGLLHDIGALLLLTRFPKQFSPVLQAGDEQAVLQRERELFGYDHADIGAMIAEHWQLPERIVRVIAEHHAPYMPEGDTRLLTAAVMQADLWEAEKRGAPVLETAYPRAELSELIRIDEPTAIEIRQQVDEAVDALCDLLLG
jgi:putative nucleotidyltransferase with HDIG domain